MRCLSSCVLLVLASSTAVAEPVVPIRVNGPDANRVSMVILGDGYTQADLLKFSTDVDLLVNALFAQSPYAEYSAYFNVYRIDVTSNESGADHPENGTMRDTALGSSYNCGGIVRTVCVDNTAVNTVLSRSNVAPDARDVVIVLVNDPAFGGSGGPVLVASTDRSVVELVLHEGGHTFGRLGDEYDSSPPPCVNNVEPAEVNVALEIGRDRIKWSRWIDAATELPTTGAQAGVPGAYLGARFCTQGLYRPTYNSKMRSLGPPFEQVNSEQLVRRVYNLVSPIDSASPSESSLAPAAGSSVEFSVVTPSPTTHELRTRWYLDDTLVSEAKVYRLNTASVSAGTHSVRLEVFDPTGLVRNDPNGLLAARRTWTVAVGQGGANNAQDALDDLLRRWRQHE